MARIFSSLMLGFIGAPWCGIAIRAASARSIGGAVWWFVGAAAVGTAVLLGIFFGETRSEGALRLKIGRRMANVLIGGIAGVCLAAVFLLLCLLLAMSLLRGIEYWFWMMATVLASSVGAYAIALALPPSRLQRTIEHWLATPRDRATRKRIVSAGLLGILGAAGLWLGYAYLRVGPYPIY